MTQNQNALKFICITRYLKSFQSSLIYIPTIICVSSFAISSAFTFDFLGHFICLEKLMSLHGYS